MPQGNDTLTILENLARDVAKRLLAGSIDEANRQVQELAPSAAELAERKGGGKVIERLVAGGRAIPGFVLEELLFSAKTGGLSGSDELSADELEALRVALDRTRRTGRTQSTGVPRIPFILPMWGRDP